MLTRLHRIKKKKDFDVVFKKGKVVRGRWATIRVVKNSLTETRFAFVISSKIAKKATVRNKIRRRLASLIKALHAQTLPSFDVVFYVSKGIQEASFLELKEMVTALLQTAGIMSK